MSDASAILFVMSLKIAKSGLLLNKVFLCLSYQKMIHEKVVHSGK